ncbi:MAG: SEC59/DGK1/VTE5 family protein [Candidatus Hydrothermarchaeota archaeon]|nr:SEC59/DGK1/VTE5 family protein [Candidatus Hydrothermarchaeota archaeon]
MELETKRQLIHASGVSVALYVCWSYNKFGFYVPFATLAAAILLLYLAAEGYKRKLRLPVISNIIDAAERAEAIEKSPASGALFFFIGSLFSLLMFSPNINVVCASILILALGDSVSTLVGRKFGRSKIFYNPAKSWEGSIGGVAFALLGALTQISLPAAFIGALAGMLAESLPIKVNDNITIPVFAGLAMSLAV